MKRAQRFLERVFGGRRESEGPDFSLERQVEAARRKMQSSLAFAMEVRDSELGVVEHSARVALVVGLLADRMGLSEADAYTLKTAAQLHEIGMYAVPHELLRRPAPLMSEELEKVRAQARISAEVARLAHPPRVADLVEHQYDDYYRLETGESVSEHGLLLAGVLRVADVYAAVTWPRPYQDPMPARYRAELLRGGAGTMFHPLAARAAVQL